MSSPSMRHPHRASVPARVAHRVNRRRTVVLPASSGGTAVRRTSPQAALGLVCGVPISLALWAVIGVAIHLG